MGAWTLGILLAMGQVTIPESGTVLDFANAYAKALDVKVRVDASLAPRRLIVLNDEASTVNGLDFVARVAGGRLVKLDDATYRLAAIPVSNAAIQWERQFFKDELDRHLGIPRRDYERRATDDFLVAWMRGLTGEDIRASAMESVTYLSNRPVSFQQPLGPRAEPELKKLSGLLEAGVLGPPPHHDVEQREHLGKVIVSLFRSERGFQASAHMYAESGNQFDALNQNVIFQFARLPLDTKRFEGASWGDVEMARAIAPVLFHSWQEPWTKAPLSLPLEAASDPLLTLARPLADALKRSAKVRRMGMQMPDGWVVTLAKGHMRAMEPVALLTLLHEERGVALAATSDEAILHPLLTESRAQIPLSRAATRAYLTALDKSKRESLADLFTLMHPQNGRTIVGQYVRLLARAMGYETWDAPIMVGVTVAALLPREVSLSTNGATTVPGFRFQDHVGVLKWLEGEATSFSEVPVNRYTHRARPSESPPTRFRMIHLNADPHQAGGPRRNVVFLETSVPGRTVSTHFVAERALP